MCAARRRCVPVAAAAASRTIPVSVSAIATKAAAGNKPKVVVLGCGWGGFKVIHAVDVERNDLTVVSPRNHFVFTPLLPSTTVGTLEFRGVIEPVRMARGEGKLRYLQATATKIDAEKKVVTTQMLYDHYDDDTQKVTQEVVDIPYDRLVIAVGGRPRTFEIEGVRQYTHFLRELQDARAIRNRILECLERASNPQLNESERRRLLHWVVVGGGPTCIEFAGEVHDFLKRDLPKYYPELSGKVKLTLIEAGDKILGNFSDDLSSMTTKLYRKRSMDVLTKTSVRKVNPHSLELSDGSTLPYGLCVWSTGVGPSKFVASTAAAGGLPVDERGFLSVGSDLRVMGYDSIFAVGDCGQIEGSPLPQTAQVAQQQGMSTPPTPHPPFPPLRSLSHSPLTLCLSLLKANLWQNHSTSSLPIRTLRYLSSPTSIRECWPTLAATRPCLRSGPESGRVPRLFRREDSFLGCSGTPPTSRSL
jgi:NADH:quinone reductase (non-electrogenic)